MQTIIRNKLLGDITDDAFFISGFRIAFDIRSQSDFCALGAKSFNSRRSHEGCDSLLGLISALLSVNAICLSLSEQEK